MRRVVLGIVERRVLLRVRRVVLASVLGKVRADSLQIPAVTSADRAFFYRLSVAVFRALLNFDLHPV